MNTSFQRTFLPLITGLVLSLALPSLGQAGSNTKTESYKRDYLSLRATVVTMREVYKKAAGEARGKAVLTEVDTRFNEAEYLAASGEYDMAILILDEGNHALAKAISEESRSKPQQDAHLQSGSAALDTHVRSEKGKPLNTKAHFEEHRTKSNALIDAARRIIAEKKIVPPLLEPIEALSQEADQLAAKGQYDAGRKRLELAEALTKKLLYRLRQGEELRAEKKFDTPADEFRHELSRNDEYGNLIELLPATQKKPDAPQHVASARKMRQAAEQQAQLGNYAEALKMIEESTIAYIRVVRDAGLPI